MPSALPSPSLEGLATQWAAQPLAILAGVIAIVWYLRAVRTVREVGAGWHRGRTAAFVAGAALFGWTTNGFPQAYSGALFSVWSSQCLILLLVVPVLLMAGQPIELARHTRGDRAVVVRFSRSRAGRLFANPLVGPALIPALSAALFFGPLPGWAIGYDVVGWPLQVAVVIAGALIVLPLVGSGDDRSSMAVGLALAVGMFELVLDAVPGIVLRLHTTLATSYFDHRSSHSWSPTALRDQQIGGALLWTVAEVIDLPFMLLVYRSWIRADARDAARIDTVLDAERLARGQNVDTTIGESDSPWWLSDPAMRNRLRRS